MTSNEPLPRNSEDLNTQMLETNIKSLVDYVNILKESGVKDPFEIEMDILNNFPDFYSEYPFIVKKISKGDDLSILYKMIKSLKKVEKGEKSLYQVELPLGEELANKYLYPNIK
jgi:hypothetical protein